MRIAVGGIIHWRESVPAWLQHLARLGAGGHELLPVFVVDWRDGGTDARAAIYRTFPGAIVEAVGGATPENLYPAKRENNSLAYTHMARLRNWLAKLALEQGADALLSVDSDIMAPPELVSALAGVGQPWVAALVRNSPHYLHLGREPSTELADKYWNVMYMPPPQPGKPLYQHFKPVGADGVGGTWPLGSICWRPQDRRQERRLITGAVALYRRELLQRVEWDGPIGTPYDPQGLQCMGEDISFGYRALEAGYYAWYVPLICEHKMEKRGNACPTFG